MFNNSNFYPYQYYPRKTGISNILKKISVGEILTGTQKTLNIINQAIPVINQAKPLFNNVKTLFKIANAINTNDKNKTNETKEKEEIKIETKKENINTNIKYNEPVFFI